MRAPTISVLLTLTFVAVAGCAGGTPPIGTANPVPEAVHVPLSTTDSVKTPALVAFDTQTGTLEYWPVRPNGGQHPRKLSPALGIVDGYGLVANGNVVAIANYSP